MVQFCYYFYFITPKNKCNGRPWMSTTYTHSGMYYSRSIESGMMCPLPDSLFMPNSAQQLFCLLYSIYYLIFKLHSNCVSKFGWRNIALATERTINEDLVLWHTRSLDGGRPSRDRVTGYHQCIVTAGQRLSTAVFASVFAALLSGSRWYVQPHKCRTDRPYCPN